MTEMMKLVDKDVKAIHHYKNYTDIQESIGECEQGEKCGIQREVKWNF